MWCEQNKKRTLSAVSHLRVNLSPYCDDTNSRLRCWWSRRVASRARVTSCSHSRFKGENYRRCFPQRFRSQSRVHVLVTRISLEGAAGSVRPSREVLSFVAHLGLRCVQYCCFTVTLFRFLAFRDCSEGGSAVFSATTRWRRAWSATTRWRARPPDAHLKKKVSEPLPHWRKVQMDSGLAPLDVQKLLSLLF